ncbi:MAG: DNA polymerase IV, partial [Bacteroides sp.]|nr:DNA polymerase IV [Bacteroides sp.]
FTVVKGYRIHEFLQRQDVSDVCGIGPNTTALLYKQNIRTAYDFTVRPLRLIQRLMGKVGADLWHELRGVSVYPLNPEEKTSYQSIMKGKTFTPSSSDRSYVYAHLLRNMESAFMKLRRYKLGTSRVVLYLKEQSFKGAGIEINLNRVTDVALDITTTIEEAFQQLFDPAKEYRSTMVCLAKLKVLNVYQFDLFEEPLRVMDMRRLGGVVDDINKRYGKHTVSSAAGLHLKRGKKTIAEEQGRYAVARRKKELLPGETKRKRVHLPLWGIRV